MTTHTPTKSSWWARQSKLVKTIIIVVAVLIVFGVIGTVTGSGDDKKTAAEEPTAAPVTTAAVEEAPAPVEEAVETTAAPVTEEAPAVPEWQTTEDYATWCAADSAAAKIDPELQAAADAVTVPEQGHVQTLYADHGTDVIARVCAPIKGDELARVAEDLAIGVKASSIGEQVETMRVTALPDDSDPSARLADMDFQVRLHNGVGDEGAVLGAWKGVDER